MHHYVYKITNQLDGKVYIGKHSTNDMDDGYMGSGKLLTRAIKKHGLEHFHKQVIATFDTEEDALEYEQKLVNESFVADSTTYNMVEGGYGSSWRYAAKRMKELWNNPEWASKRGKEQSQALTTIFKERWNVPEERKKISDRRRQRTKKLHAEGRLKSINFHWDGKHTEETRRKISKSKKGTGAGKQNSQFGTMWIKHEGLQQSKRIKKDDFQSYLDQGWMKGAKFKWR